MRVRITNPDLEYVLSLITATEPNEKHGFRVIELHLKSNDGSDTIGHVTMAQMDFDRIAKLVADCRNITAA